VQNLEQAQQLHKRGLLAEAESAYRVVLQNDPRNAHALHMLGILLQQQARTSEATAAIQKAIDLEPEIAEFHYNLGKVLTSYGQVDSAVDAYRRAIALRPDFYAAYKNLGNALTSLGHPNDAIEVFRIATLIQPQSADAHFLLGTAMLRKGKLNAAIVSLQKSVSLRSEYPEAFNNLGIAYQQLGAIDSAISAFRGAIACRVDFADAYNNLGALLKDTGEIHAAIGSLERAERFKPDPRFGSNLLFSLHLDPDMEARRIVEAHRKWNQLYTQSLRSSVAHRSASANEDRRLRVAYVSPGFCRGVIGRFMLPLLANHDHTQFEVHCYADGPVEDDLSQKLAASADGWHRTEGLSDEQLAQRVRDDRIDIFVDLTMHMMRNRLLVFARKPAPVQVTYLAYCSTTGLSAMDYRLTDHYLDPPGAAHSQYSEESMRLADTYWCYAAPSEASDIRQSPAVDSGVITFGCLNAPFKLNRAVLTTWASILIQIPGSRLLLHTGAGSHRERFRKLFADAGVDSSRVDFVGEVPVTKYFGGYHHIDIALDPFPYGGGTTTCDALWMGVPVVSLAGNLGVSRGGLSILSNIGLADLVATDQQGYIRIATELARNIPRLQSVRMAMRQRMLASPLMDAPGFARSVEAAYRQMWQRRCASHTG